MPGAEAVRVHREIFNNSGRAVGETARLAGGTLGLHGCGPRCAVDHTVTAPVGTTVHGSTSAGDITLSNVSNVDVLTENGRLTVADIDTGPVRLRSVNGPIRGTGLGGDGIQAQSENGGIELTATKPQNISAHLQNGTIQLAVPASGYRVRTSKENGTVDIGVPHDPNGAYLLDLGLTNGEIVVQPAGS